MNIRLQITKIIWNKKYLTSFKVKENMQNTHGKFTKGYVNDKNNVYEKQAKYCSKMRLC